MQANSTLPDTTSSLRKAAILYRSLDTDAAAQLLAHLGPDEASKLRAALRELGTVEEEELSSVAAEFELNTLESNGSRLKTQLADLRHLTAAPDVSPPFRALLETDIATLLGFLEREHAQTVAVVLSYLPPNKAAEALAGLSEGRQTEVVQRLAELGDTDPESLRVVELSLETWLAEQSREDKQRVDRLSIVREIMAATQDKTRQTILLRLRHRDHGLAREIEQQLRPTRLAEKECDLENTSHEKPFELPTQPPTVALAFDDLAEIPDHVLSTIISTVDADLLRCALAGASDRLLARVHRLLPRSERKQFQRQLQHLGPTTLRDVDAAQRMIAEMASRLLARSPGVIFERLAA